jgi:acyl-coenzyme A thioesterase PaaI-like protein
LTVDLAIKFLRPAPVADLIAEARLLRLSKRRSDVVVTISSAQCLDGPVAHATATFAPRPPRPVGAGSS